MIRRLSASALLLLLFLLTSPALHAQNCPLAPRLVIGEMARVTPGEPNNIRAQPGQSGDYLGEIPPGEFFMVLGGPTCSSGINWWRIQYNGLEGWTPEGDAGEYWVEPQQLIATLTNTPVPTNSPTPTNQPTWTPTPAYTPTITPTRLPMFATAAALGFDLAAEANASDRPVSVMFNGVPMMLVRAGCYERDVTPQQTLELMAACVQNPERTIDVCNPDEYFTDNSALCFDQPYWIDRDEVSHLQYETYLNHADTPHQFNFVRWSDDHPRGDIRYEDAVRHCFLRGARIPTDVEWEYAARGPESWIFPWGDLYDAANGVNNLTAEKFFNSDGSFLLKPVTVNNSTTLVNDVSWVGAHHLSGNVAEWVAATVPDERVEYTIRGGSANHPPLAMRLHAWPAPGLRAQDVYIGFRCVRPFQMEDLALVIP